MSKSIGTVHVTNGKTSMVINAIDLGTEKYKGFDLVEKAKKKSTKKTASKKADK